MNLEETGVVEFIFNSASHLDEFDARREFYVKSLRTDLNNFHIQVKTKIVENKTDNHVLTKHDIYKEMLKQNPDLEGFVKDLGLDLYD